MTSNRRIIRLGEPAAAFAIVNPNASQAYLRRGGYGTNKNAILQKLQGAKINIGSGTGTDLRNAVRSWQEKYNNKGYGAITVDGIIGNQTLTAMGIRALKPLSSPGGSGGGLSGAKSVLTDAIKNPGKYLQSAKNVRSLQSAINQYAAAVGIAKLSVDGQWGNKSRAAFKAAQSYL